MFNLFINKAIDRMRIDPSYLNPTQPWGVDIVGCRGCNVMLFHFNFCSIKIIIFNRQDKTHRYRLILHKGNNYG